jgi:alpha-L-fucosidase
MYLVSNHRPSRRKFLADSSLAAGSVLLAGKARSLSSAIARELSLTATGPFQPTWASLRAHYHYPEWFHDAKFGIFLHWGVYSVPAHGSEWYKKHMYGDPATIKWHTEHYGPPAKFGYKNFIPMFKAQHWDPDAWAELFKHAGAKYVMPVAIHHDGFAMWDSAVVPWNAARMGPHRDVIGELGKAVRRQGMKFGFSNHYMEHYNFIQPLPGLKTDLYDPKWAAFYSVADRSPAAFKRFLAMWVAASKELIDKYEPDTLFYDNGVNPRKFDPQKLEVAAYYYNRASEWKKAVTILTKDHAYLAGNTEDYERQQRAPLTIQPHPWECDDSVGYRWGYLKNDHYWHVSTIVTHLVENVSRNGNLLLNFGPKPDGTFVETQLELMKGIGAWLRVNGEAIYETRPWSRFGEGASVNGRPPYTGSDFRFTTKGDVLYAIVMAWPGQHAVVRSLATSDALKGKVEQVQLLGHNGPLHFVQDAQGLTVTMPSEQPCQYAYSLKISGLKFA